MKRLIVVVLFVVTASGVHAVDPPRARARDGWIEVQLSGTMLDDAGVRQRAESGLTAILVVVDRTRRTSPPGVARIAVRYELWDEVFLVSVTQADRTRSTKKADSLDALRRHLESTVIRLRPSGPDDGDEMVVEVRLVPFSADEERDAREWFIDTLGATPKGGSSGGISSVEGVVDVLLATSIEARPVATWKWTVPLQRVAEGDP